MSDIKTILHRLQSEIEATDVELQDAGELSRLHNLMATYEGEDKVEDSHTIAARIQERGEEVVYKTGIVGLDELLHGGFRPGDSVLIAAVTKHGKTEFCTYLTQTMSDTKPLWFSYEDGSEQLVQRFLDRDREVPLFYSPKHMKARTVDWIEERTVEAIAKHGTKMIFVDNLGFLVPRGQNISTETGFVTKKLKQLANRWGIVVVVVTHLKLNAQIDKQPDLNDIRDSGFPAADANTVLMLWRQTVRHHGQVVITNNANISVQAARRGTPGNVKLVFDDGIYQEIAWEDSYETDAKFDAL